MYSLLVKSSLVSVFLVYAVRPFDVLEPCNHYSLSSIKKVAALVISFNFSVIYIYDNRAHPRMPPRFADRQTASS